MSLSCSKIIQEGNIKDSLDNKNITYKLSAFGSAHMVTAVLASKNLHVNPLIAMH